MVDIDATIRFGSITKGDFSSPASGIINTPSVDKEGPVTPGITPPHKAPSQWRVLEGSRDLLDRRGKRAHVPREYRELWEPDARLVAKQADLQLKDKEIDIKKLELRIQEQRGANAQVELQLKELDVRVLLLKNEQ